MASFGTRPGIPLPDGRTIPLFPDGLFNLSLYNTSVLNMTNWRGMLDGYGRAQATLPIPNLTGIIGTQFYVAFVSINSSLPGFQSITGISTARHITIQP